MSKRIKYLTANGYFYTFVNEKGKHSRKHQMPEDVNKTPFIKCYWKATSSLITYLPFMIDSDVRSGFAVETYIVKTKHVCGLRLAKLKRMLWDTDGIHYEN